MLLEYGQHFEAFITTQLVCTSVVNIRAQEVDKTGPSTALAVLPRTPGGIVMAGSRCRI